MNISKPVRWNKSHCIGYSLLKRWRGSGQGNYCSPIQLITEISSHQYYEVSGDPHCTCIGRKPGLSLILHPSLTICQVLSIYRGPSRVSQHDSFLGLRSSIFLVESHRRCTMDLENGLPNTTDFWSPSPSQFDSFSPETPATNTSANNTSHHYDLTSNAVLTFIYFVVCIVGLCGNTLVIYVILRYAKMKTITNIYILNLAIADELFMLGLPFLAMQVALVHWPFGKAICRIVMTVDGINQFTSIFCLTVMSVDRYLAVVHPIKSAKWRRPRTAKMVNVAVWGISLLVILPIMIYAGVSNNHGSSSCTMIWPDDSGAWYAGFIIYAFILGFLVPLTIICLCYLFIIIKVKSSGIRVGSSKRKKSEKKVTRMVSIVVAVFIFCWLPFYIFNVSSVSVLIVPTPVLKGMFDFVVVLTYANSCANPILYAFLSDNFKKSFQNVLCLVKVSGMDETDRSDSKQDKSRLNEATETQRTLLNGDLQTSI